MSDDRQWPAYDAGTPSPRGQEPPASGTPVPYEGQQTPPPPPSGGGTDVGALVLVVLALLLVLGLTGGGLALLVADGVSDSDDGAASDRLPDVPVPVTPDLPDPPRPSSGVPDGPGAGAPPVVLSAEGLDALVRAVEARTGGSRVFSAVLYPEYAVTDIPVRAGSQDKQGLRWDGAELADFGPPGTAVTGRVDLAAVDGELLVRLVARAKRLVDDPTSWYVVVEGPPVAFDDDGTRIRAYAVGSTGTAYLATRLDGTVVRRYLG